MWSNLSGLHTDFFSICVNEVMLPSPSSRIDTLRFALAHHMLCSSLAWPAMKTRSFQVVRSVVLNNLNLQYNRQFAYFGLVLETGRGIQAENSSSFGLSRFNS